MNIPCTWDQVTPSLHQLRTPRGIMLAQVNLSDGCWYGEVAKRTRRTKFLMAWDGTGYADDLDAAKTAAEELAARSVT